MVYGMTWENELPPALLRNVSTYEYWARLGGQWVLVTLASFYGGAFSIGGFTSGLSQDAVTYFQTRLSVLAVHVRVGEIAPLCACASEPTLLLSLLGRSCWAACGDRFTGLDKESGCVCACAVPRVCSDLSMQVWVSTLLYAYKLRT